MKLPRRTRTHILEDLSVRKLESLLPDAWIYRIPSHDYGIDGEVEIIDTEGYTTGKKFLVQLKATDGSDCTVGDCQQSVSVRIGKLDLPVLDTTNTNAASGDFKNSVDLTELLPRLYWRDQGLTD